MWIYANASEEVWNRETDDEFARYRLDLTQEAARFGPLDRVQVSHAGLGASWPIVLIQFVLEHWYLLLIAMFFQGKRINENLDAWLALIRRTKTALDSLTVGFGCRADLRFAAGLAAEAVSKQIGELKSLKLLSVTLIHQMTRQVSTYSSVPSKWVNPDLDIDDRQSQISLLEYNTLSFEYAFIFLIEVNDSRLFNVVVEANGQVGAPQPISTI